jgi:hypothetical protein
VTTETTDLKAELQRLINNNPQRMNRAISINDGLFAEALLTLVVRMERLESYLRFKEQGNSP